MEESVARTKTPILILYSSFSHPVMRERPRAPTAVARRRAETRLTNCGCGLAKLTVLGERRVKKERKDKIHLVDRRELIITVH